MREWRSWRIALGGGGWTNWALVPPGVHVDPDLIEAGIAEEREVSENEFTIKVDQAQVEIGRHDPVYDGGFARGYRSDLTYDHRPAFELKGFVDQLAVSTFPGTTGEYDIEVTVKLKRKFVAGHYRLKSSGRRATVMYHTTPPWEQNRMVAGNERRKKPDAWERVDVKGIVQ